jgi:hypothetical protein
MLIMKKKLYQIVNYFLNKQWVLHIVMRFLSEEKKEKIAIESIRQNFMLFGHNCSDMTDEEIKEGVKNVGSFGATKEEAEKALRVLGDCA